METSGGIVDHPDVGRRSHPDREPEAQEHDQSSHPPGLPSATHGRWREWKQSTDRGLFGSCHHGHRSASLPPPVVGLIRVCSLDACSKVSKVPSGGRSPSHPWAGRSAWVILPSDAGPVVPRSLPTLRCPRPRRARTCLRGHRDRVLPPWSGRPAAGRASSRFLYVVRTGGVELLDDGLVIDLLEEGEMFGHPSLVAGLPPTFSVRAFEDTIRYLIERQVAEEVPEPGRASSSSLADSRAGAGKRRSPLRWNGSLALPPCSRRSCAGSRSDAIQRCPSGTRRRRWRAKGSRRSWSVRRTCWHRDGSGSPDEGRRRRHRSRRAPSPG